MSDHADTEGQGGVPPLAEWKEARLVPPVRPAKSAPGVCHAPAIAAPPAGYVDRAEAVASMAARHGLPERVAAAELRIAEALRAAAAEYPDLTDEEAVEALRTMEGAVSRAGVPRRRVAP